MNPSFFILCFVLIQISSVVLRNQPFQSKKSPTETIEEYEVILPELTAGPGNSNEHHPKNIRVTVRSEHFTFNLKLQLNENLLSPKFASGYHYKGELHEQGHENCFYHGSVEEHPEWKAVFSTCYGLRGWFGDINDKDNLYHIEPLEETSALDDKHVLYKDSEHKNDEDGVCGTHHDYHDIGDLAGTNTYSPNHHILKKRQSSETLIVEWLLVNDFNQYINYNQNLSAVVHRAIEIANHVDMLYRVLNIRVALVYSLTWTDSQRIQATTDADTLLNLFEEYHRTTTEFRNFEHDSAMLITGIEIAGATVGVAFLDRMCVYDQSVGFTQDKGSSINSVGAIAAHELGHIFSMQHDDAAACNCPDENGCIMNAQLGFPSPSQFSQCSTNQLSEALGLGRGICLNNNPSMLVGEPTCGNGIKEPGEVCDCGSLQECQDPCCNATTCTLSIGSQCAEGPCCTDCRFLRYGITCRESRGECGIAEYCSGDSAECPQDVYLQNGVSCESNLSYCYDGMCVSHSAQCIQYYGQDSEPSVQECYDQFNVQGEPFGHCGAANGEFLRCALENVNCGSIQCSGGRINFDNIEFTGTITAYTRNVFVEGDFEQCRSFSTSATSDTISPGLVLEGTKCGDEKLCLSQRCVSVTMLGISPCIVGANGQICSGNGVCNNLDQCSCNVGYNGTACEERVRNGNTKSSSSRDVMMTSGGLISSLTVSMVTPLITVTATPIQTTTSTQIIPTINIPINVGAVVGGVVAAVLILIIVFVIIGVSVAVFVLCRGAVSSKSVSPARKKYSKGYSVDGNRPGVHSSTDDLLMTTVGTDGTSPSPVPLSSRGPYRPYVPPSYVPSTTVSQNARRPPPPPNPTSKASGNQKNTPRPPPPSRPAPPSNKPIPPVNRPAPPTNRPIPSAPKKPTPVAPKPAPAPRHNPGQNPPAPATRPGTAPKPSKVGGVQWPPPNEESVSKSGPVPSKKPIVPPRY